MNLVFILIAIPVIAFLLAYRARLEMRIEERQKQIDHAKRNRSNKK